MDRQQERHEKHDKERQHKQAEERQSEQQFSKPGPTIRPVWFLAAGILLTCIALIIWWRAWLPF
jgi:fatty acid desaturase